MQHWIPSMLLARSPSCLSCLRRTFGQNGAQGAAGLVQLRGKKRGSRPRDQGVVVRLLDDISGFGRKDAILRTTRGRMRNLWLPNKKAEYMTTTRFAELGLTSDDVGEPDPLFTADVARVNGDAGASNTQRPKLEVKSLAPEEAAALLMAALPPVLTFSRKPIQAVELSTQLPTSQEAATEGDAAALFGSVSTDDIALKIRDLIRQSEASQVRVGGRDVRFIGLDGAVDRVKTLGRWEIDISLGTQGSDSNAHSVRRVVEVVAEQ